jgi:hypothetical protein
MIRELPPIIARLIPRLSSPFDAERLATIAAIERALRAANKDWHDIAAAVTAQSLPAPWNYEPRRTESDEAHRTRVWLETISREDWLNEWTIEFIASLLRRRSLDNLSERQLACIDRIIHEAFDRGVRPGREAA